MGRGRRYDDEPKLNMKKVFGVIIIPLLIILSICMFKNYAGKEKKTGRIVSKSYFTAYKDNKWGVIDELGSYVIDPSYGEMIVIPNLKSDVFICTYDVNYQNGEYKTKALNSKNEQIYNEYEYINVLQSLDSNNNLVIDSNVLLVKKDGKYGLISIAGKQVLPTQYDEIVSISGIENAYKIKKDDKYGIANNEGKIVIEPKYLDIDVLGKDNKSGFIVKNEDKKYGIVDYSNNVVLNFKYDSIKKVFGNNLYVVKQDGKEKLVSKDNDNVLNGDYDTIEQVLNSQENAVIFSKSGKFGIMKLSGEVEMSPKYDSLTEAKVGFFIAKIGDKYGIVSSEDDVKKGFESKMITYNSKADIYVLEDEKYNAKILNGNLDEKINGILLDLNIDKGYIKCKTGEDIKYYNFKFDEKTEQDIYPNRTLFLSKRDGKYGFVDKNGNVVVDYIYDEAMEQNEFGYCSIKQDNKWGSIDYTGNVVLEPTYDLSDYLYIDFIGNWHISSDLNMKVYNQL